MPTPRTTVRRRGARGAYDRATIDAILDEGKVCHVAVADEDGPVVLPTGYVRIGDEVLVHGAAGNHLLRLAVERPVCVTVTLLDGLVLAKTAFHHSMNYRSVVAFGRGRLVEGDEKRAALDAFVEHMVPGRSTQARPPTQQELDSTLVVAVPLGEASAKVRSGGPVGEEDEDIDVWTGVIPVALIEGEPVAAQP
jgi:nitroimidazol reductase NimA-like FMN-containing flavoprotein (pyridoxamine 5'-phosphate oxidase superfamily)